MNRRTVAVVVLLALVGALGAAAVVTYRSVLRPSGADDGLLVVAVLGSDVGVPHRPGDPLRGRADAIHLVAVDGGTRRATVVDIPRDAVVAGTKVNAHLADGGPEALVAELEAFTGLTVDHWVLTTFRGFERLTRAIGGVDVQVDVPMHDPSSGSDFEPGRRVVRGATALAFARDRHSLPDGDFGRTRHQGDLLLALHRRLVADATDLDTMVALAAAVARTTVTDIPPGDLLALALHAATIDPADVAHVSLSGQVDTVDGASVVWLTPGDTFRRIADGQVGPPRR